MATRRVPRIRARAIHPAADDLGYLGSLLVDGPRVYACGGAHGSPTLLVSDDGGRSFRRLATPKTSGLRSIVRAGGALYVVGEYGTVAASVDSGLTWTAIPVDTQTCLFALHRAPDGTWWIIGDDGVVLRSSDGIAYRAVDTGGWEARLLSIATIDGTTYILGFDGTIKRWTGSALATAWCDHEPEDVASATALTQLIVTRTGAWIVTGDGGIAYRSEDGGETFEMAEVAGVDDLEAILELPQGLLVVGGDGLVLFSDDDGRTFWKVETAMTGHLWSLAVVGDAILVGGDDGAIWALDVSASQTMEASNDEDEDDEDEDDDDDEDEDDDEAVTPATFESVAAASERWIREGAAFADALNAYVRRCYEVGPNKAGHEPSETREDMADYVRAQLAELNRTGEHRRARELFPPAYEPFDYGRLGRQIDGLAYLRDGRIVARVGGECFELARDRITPIPDVVAFAQSHDRRWVAKLTAGGIAIHDGWDGPCTRTIPHVLSDLAHAVVVPQGDAVLAASEDGIYWLTEASRRRLLPDEAEESVDYPHAALSPNGRFAAIGTKDTSHVLIDRKTGRRYSFDPVSSYPCFAAFHADRPDVLFSSCHALYGSATLAVDLDTLVGARKEPSRVLNRKSWVFSSVSMPFGYVIGDRSGYLWAVDFTGAQQWYVFLGSTLTALAISPDGTRLVAGSYAGIVVELDLTAPASDPRLLTNGPVRDAARWLFWQGHEPMLW